MSKAQFPRLRRKGKAYYFDTQRKPRVWIPLGSDPVVAMERYKRLMGMQGGAGTVQRLLVEYLDHLRAGGIGAFGKPVTKSTIAMYETWAKHVGAVFGHIDPADLTQGAVAQYLRKCQRTSARGEMSLLSSAYQHALAEGRLHFNPCIGVKSSRPRARRDRYLSDGEIAAIHEKAPPILRVAIDLAYLTGLRISDLLAARWDQFGDGNEFIEHAKTGVRQRFVVTPDLREVLDAARALQGRIGSIYVLAGRGGQPLNRHTVGTWWRKACEKAGVIDAHWHDIRAKAGTDEDAAGGNAQALLGHASAQTTRTYLRGKRIVSIEPRHRKNG